ncbi:MAG TPA: flavodoxin family protein [Epsilonproteobacteria bacterium]|nr:flavodoxin family protein [Campylobacterota bacterium]
MTKILAINGSYRNNGITDQIVNTMAETLQTAGAEVEIIELRNYPIEFCLNCRECTQKPGEQPGECVQHDGMEELIDKIEKSDGYILASPTNFGSVTAIFKRFMERLVVYGYWPWGMNAPKDRKENAPKKKAVLVSSCAAPGIMGRWLFCTHKQLKTTAQTIGAESIGTFFTGLVSNDPDYKLSEKEKAKTKTLAEKLLTQSSK